MIALYGENEHWMTLCELMCVVGRASAAFARLNENTWPSLSPTATRFSEKASWRLILNVVGFRAIQATPPGATGSHGPPPGPPPVVVDDAAP